MLFYYRYPEVSNLGDMVKIYDNSKFKESIIEVLVGGTPCQSFSQAGLRLGLDDPRGNLALHFLRIAKEKQPRWIVWENVPGVLSIGRGTKGVIFPPFSNNGQLRVWRLLQRVGRTIFWVAPKPSQSLRCWISWKTGDPPPQYFLSAKHLITTLREAAKRRGVYLFVRREMQEMPTLEVLSWLKLLKEKKIANSNDLNLKKGRTSVVSPQREEKRIGFSGRYTEIPSATDAKRYKAIGNSMAVPVMRWIGTRIQAFEDLKTNGEQMRTFTKQTLRQV